MKTQRQISVDVAAEVLQERLYQISREGFEPQMDDVHAGGDIARTAASYAISSVEYPKMFGHTPPALWPWDLRWWKPTNRRRDLVKAGALILAEIERIDRVDREVRKDVRVGSMRLRSYLE